MIQVISAFIVPCCPTSNTSLFRKAGVCLLFEMLAFRSCYQTLLSLFCTKFKISHFISNLQKQHFIQKLSQTYIVIKKQYSSLSSALQTCISPFHLLLWGFCVFLTELNYDTQYFFKWNYNFDCVLVLLLQQLLLLPHLVRISEMPC